MRLERADLLDDRVGIGAVADEIAEHERAVVGQILGGGEHRLERLHVGVNVARGSR